MNCDEHLCVKGDKVRNKNLRRWHDETKGLLTHSKAAQSAGVEGADRWTQHQTRTLARVEQILEVYDDQTVPNGSVIQPAWESRTSYVLQRDRLRFLTTHTVLSKRSGLICFRVPVLPRISSAGRASSGEQFT